jgi:hypothetical protein
VKGLSWCDWRSRQKSQRTDGRGWNFWKHGAVMRWGRKDVGYIAWLG